MATLNRYQDDRLLVGAPSTQRAASLPIQSTHPSRPASGPSHIRLQIVEIISSDDEDVPYPPTKTPSTRKPPKTTRVTGRRPHLRYRSNNDPAIPDNTGTPGRVQFPADFPGTLTPLFLDFFRAQNSNIVPRAIYFMQVPWIFKLHNGRRKADCTDANYFVRDPTTGLIDEERPVAEMRVMTLPWMHKQHGGKNAQRCIMVRDGRLEKGKWVVLARCRGWRNDFRVWRGAKDDEFEQASVVKKGVVAGEAVKGSGSRTVRKGKAGSRWELASYRKLQLKSAKERAREVVELDDSDGGGDATEQVPYLSPALPSTEIAQDDLPRAPKWDESAPLPSVAVHEPEAYAEDSDDDDGIIDLSQQVVFHFNGPSFRTRTLFSCGNFHSFFGNASAAGLITAYERYPVLKCVVAGSDGAIGQPWIVADEVDFTELVRTVMSANDIAGVGDDGITIHVGR
ncbi:uncharacterized protein AB675_6962 [Cyphellophora attinorum]|uniref:Uncharacterized protein n=1 Tax=Cyphellophora attinorum TaxID=1664694 RepID=A0A0N1HUW4_9EURO|nr:uncharacterized protein AB675_6962 [Phialophora attinorum]KPI43327.1 hypothetical protein AB675_6962 [Phialophora attinorum]